MPSSVKVKPSKDGVWIATILLDERFTPLIEKGKGRKNKRKLAVRYASQELLDINELQQTKDKLRKQMDDLEQQKERIKAEIDGMREPPVDDSEVPE